MTDSSSTPVFINNASGIKVADIPPECDAVKDATTVSIDLPLWQTLPFSPEPGLEVEPLFSSSATPSPLMTSEQEKEIAARLNLPSPENATIDSYTTTKDVDSVTNLLKDLGDDTDTTFDSYRTTVDTDSVTNLIQILDDVSDVYAAGDDAKRGATSVTNLLNDLDDVNDAALLSQGSSTLSKMIKAMRIAVSTDSDRVAETVISDNRPDESPGSFWRNFKDHVVDRRDRSLPYLPDASLKCPSPLKGSLIVRESEQVLRHGSPSAATRSKFDGDDAVSPVISERSILTSLKRLFSKEDVAASGGGLNLNLPKKQEGIKGSIDSDITDSQAGVKTGADDRVKKTDGVPEKPDSEKDADFKDLHADAAESSNQDSSVIQEVGFFPCSSCQF